MPTDKDIKEAEKLLKTFKEAIVKERAELIQIRSDKSVASKQTMADLETSIPTLQKQESNLKSSISTLEGFLKLKKDTFDAKEVDLKSHYRKLEDSLIADYKIKSDAIDMERQDIKSKLSALSYREANLKSDMEKRERQLNEAYKDLEKDSQSLKEATWALSRERDEFAQVVHDGKMEIEHLKKEAAGLKDKATDQNREADDRIHDVFQREQRAEAAISREAVVEHHAIILAQKEQELDQKQADINIEIVKWKAESRRMNQRDDQQNEREHKLDERANNLKILESKV